VAATCSKSHAYSTKQRTSRLTHCCPERISTKSADCHSICLLETAAHRKKL
jgi:hypothetical protein